jgi:TPR repeat protein
MLNVSNKKVVNFIFISALITSFFTALPLLAEYPLTIKEKYEIKEPTLELNAIPQKFLKTEDEIIWYGRGCPIATKYCPKKFEVDEEIDLIIAGLEYLKNNCKHAYSNEILTRYYEERKEYSRSLYWALSGAEKGSNYCMGILRWAYANGVGVVEDQIEASKWMYLAAALGNKEEKKLLELQRDLQLIGSYSDPNNEEGRKRAQDWMKEHSGLFINENG